MNASRHIVLHPLRLAIMVGAAWLAIGASSDIARAQSTWDGGGGDAFWATAGNWNLDTVPTWGASADIFFAGNLRTTSTNNVTSGTVRNLSLLDTGFALNGNLLAVTGTIDNLATTGTNTLGLGISLVSGPRAFRGANGGTLLLAGGISGTGGINFSNSTGSGTTAFVLAGANSYSGTTAVAGNTLLSLNSNAALGSSFLRISAGGVVDNLSGSAVSLTNNIGNANSYSTVTFQLTNPITTSGLLYSPPSVDNCYFQLNGTNALRVGGLVLWNCFKSGSGTLDVAGPSSLGGQRFGLRGGTLILSHTAALAGTVPVEVQLSTTLQSTIDLSAGSGISTNFTYSSSANATLTVSGTQSITLSSTTVAINAGYIGNSLQNDLSEGRTLTFKSGTVALRAIAS